MKVIRFYMVRTYFYGNALKKECEEIEQAGGTIKDIKPGWKTNNDWCIVYEIDKEVLSGSDNK